MNDITNAIFRGIAAYLLLLFISRFVERKIIAQMTFFDFIVAITLGSLGANMAIGNGNNFLISAVIIITLSVLALLTGLLNLKSFTFRKIVNSEPVTLIKNGEVIKENMDKTRLTINKLNTLLREKNIFNIADVEFALLEDDGMLSVLPKSQKKPLTPSDLNIPTTYMGLTSDLIIDGNIMHENLHSAKLDEQWLKSQLREKGIDDVNDVFFAALDTSGNLYVSKGNKKTEEHGEYGIE